MESLGITQLRAVSELFVRDVWVMCKTEFCEEKWSIFVVEKSHN